MLRAMTAVEVPVLVSVNPLPLMETMTSPALSPASAAGVVLPAQWSRANTFTLFVDCPKVRTRMRARTKAMRKCMAEPAEATMIRWWNGCWR